MSFLLNTSSNIMCSHGGTVTMIPTASQVLVDGSPVLVLPDTGIVGGCAFTVPGPKPQPCVTVRWTATPAMQVLANGSPVLVQSATGICQSGEQIPQGAPLVVSTQFKVKA